MTIEYAADGPSLDIPNLSNDSGLVRAERELGKMTYSDLLVLGACRKILAIWTKAYAPNIKIAIL